jgi:alginate O-acetyltransferase complex protein AlgI
MVFSSETFLFLFLPLFLALYYLTPMRFRSMTILVASYLFYGWFRFDFLGLLILTTLWTYGFGILIGRSDDDRRRKLFITIGVTGCLSVLGVFKYLNFFVDSIAAMFGTDAAGLGVHWRLVLPIGVSFYVFHSISYLMDIYRRDVDPTVNFFDFAAFLALFPQLVAGPILRFKDLANQFTDRVHSPQLFADGMARFIIGLGKKVILADAIAPLANLAFTTQDPSLAVSWLSTVAYMLQLYFDFSGYSDMAVGLGMMIGFRFRENFNAPYVSRSITEFWRRWHISLSVWLRDYLYIPLGGNRKGERRTYFNLITVMFLGGLWHGANWTFVAWGIWHGGWLAFERATGRATATGTLPLVRTLIVVLIGWVVFRAANITQALDIYSGMLGLNGVGIPLDIAVQITRESVLLMALAATVAAFELRLNAYARSIYYTPPDMPLPGSGGTGVLTAATSLWPTLLLGTTLCLSIMKLAEQSFSPFLYFQF